MSDLTAARQRSAALLRAAIESADERVDCPAHAWQTIHSRGRQDGRQIAEDALVRHWETTHDNQGNDVGQVTP